MEDIFEEAKPNEMYALESKVGERVKEELEKLKKTLTKELKDIVWTACNDYAEWAEFEPLQNWKDRARSDLLGDNYHESPDFWGKKMRAKIYEENKTELIPLIRNERILALEKEVEDLRKQIKFEIELNQRRY